MSCLVAKASVNACVCDCVCVCVPLNEGKWKKKGRGRGWVGGQVGYVGFMKSMSGIQTYNVMNTVFKV